MDTYKVAIQKLLDKLIETINKKSKNKSKNKNMNYEITPKIISKLKQGVSRDLNLNNVIPNSEILRYIKTNNQLEDKYKKLSKYFVKKPMRTGSGVVPVAVMIKPEGSCKHNCIYCPYTGKAAKSYTGEEPAALRARGANFDPYVQVKTRLKQYEETGHDTTKIELIVMGGTFLEMDSEYKTYFIKSLYDALNNSISETETLNDAIKINEKSNHRAVGLTIETRPDVCNKTLINEMLKYGTTRVELGVQNPNDEIYKLVKRGHNIKDVVDATLNLRDAGIKVLYHVMLGLPGSSPKEDIKMVKQIFSDARFKPDMIKIYPTLLMKNTELYDIYKKGEYKPYSSDLAARTIAESYKYIPKYVRVMRIQRDIPANLIEDGVKKSNLRQLVEHEMDVLGIQSKDIRNREIGKRKASDTKDKMSKISEMEIKTLKYETLGGTEFFISYENEENIAGFIRLRFPIQSWKCRQMKIEKCAIIRELHVYGQETPFGFKGEVQHKGIGSKLLNTAEDISIKNEKENIIIQSGVGVREYYKKRGYNPMGTYMHKKL